MASPAMTALMAAAMMVAMMLPSIAPTIWRYYRRLRAMRIPRAAFSTTVLAVGYASVWTVIGLALFALNASVYPMGMVSSAHSALAPWAGALVLCAGVLQRSRWKARQLLLCREACVDGQAGFTRATAAMLAGCRLGVDCGLSCAAPMAILLAAGIMDTRMMAVVTASITAERVAPGGARIARMTGTIALVAGVVMCMRAIGVTLPGAA